MMIGWIALVAGAAITFAAVAMTLAGVFLTASWRNLAMLNFTIEPHILEPHVPKGTQLDLFNGRTYVSLVGFRFLHTRVRGWTIPFHVNFEEINLRFYVRRKADDGWRRMLAWFKQHGVA